jgi:hypothetical protein
MIDPTAANNSRLVELFAAADADDAAAAAAAEEATHTRYSGGDRDLTSAATDTTTMTGEAAIDPLLRPQLSLGVVAGDSAESIMPSPRESPLARSVSSQQSPAQDNFQSDADPTYSYCQVRERRGGGGGW